MCRITVHQGYEYRTYVRNLYDDSEIDGKITDEFYYPQYMQAAMCIDEIATRLNEYREKTKKEKNHNELVDAEFDNYSSLMGYPNNIVAFCSRRGQGKSSAMLTMLRALQVKDEQNYRDSARLFWDEAHRLNFYTGENNPKSSVPDIKYHVFATIDPTTMEIHDSILDVIISRIMAKVRDEHSRRQENPVERNVGELPVYRDVMRKVQEAVRRIRSVKKENTSDDIGELERISDTDDNRSPKFAFRELVDAFLEYIGKDMLVIAVDDADMAPDRSYEIVEDLRKYCVVPRVMIVMAVHLATLKNCVEQHFIKYYRYLLDTGYETDHLQKYACRNIAQRYIDKLLPDIHQIHLHYVEDKIEDGKRISLSYRDRKGNELLKVGEDYVGKLARLVYDKTGVILLDSKKWLHNFMPKRMRELTHMLSYFTRMDDIDDEERNYNLVNLMIYKFYGVNPGTINDAISFNEDNADRLLRAREHNLDMLEDYFFEHWCPVNLTKRLCNDMIQLRIAPLRSKNRRAMEIMRSYKEEKNDENNNRETGVGRLVEEPDRYSYTDVLNEMKRCRDTVKSPFKYDLIYAIGMYYTIYMNKIVSRSLSQGDVGILGNLYTLTRGQMTRDVGDLFIVEAAPIEDAVEKQCDLESKQANGVDDSDKSSEKSGDGKDTILKSLKRYLRPVVSTKDDDIRLNTYEIDKWKKESSFDKVKYVRFDPSLVLFVFIEDLINKDQVDFKPSGEKENLKDVFYGEGNKEEMSPGVSTIILQYLCNYDVQYRVRKEFFEKTDVISFEDPDIEGAPGKSITARNMLIKLVTKTSEQDARFSLVDILMGEQQSVEHCLELFGNDKGVIEKYGKQLYGYLRTKETFGLQTLKLIVLQGVTSAIDGEGRQARNVLDEKNAVNYLINFSTILSEIAEAGRRAAKESEEKQKKVYKRKIRKNK